MTDSTVITLQSVRTSVETKQLMVITDRKLEACLKNYRSLVSVGFCSGGKQCSFVYKYTVKQKAGEIWILFINVSFPMA